MFPLVLETTGPVRAGCSRPLFTLTGLLSMARVAQVGAGVEVLLDLSQAGRSDGAELRRGKAGEGCVIK